MRLRYPTKIFLACAVLLFISIASGCRQTGNIGNAVPAAEVEEFPFSVKEPETFQAEIVVSSAGGSEQKTFVAKDGVKRRTDYDAGGPDQLTVLETDRKYLISHRDKIYAVDEPAGAAGEGVEDATAPMFDSREFAAFEKIGAENGLTEYRARPREGGASEVIVYVDGSLGLPVKQEFYSVDGDRRTLQYSVEMANIRREIEEGVFEIPAGFRQTSIDEFRKIAGRR